MRKYYYSVGGTRVGPVTIEELKVVSGVSPETLVWYNGLSGWVRAADIGELSELFAAAPPPPPVAGVAPVPVSFVQLLRGIYQHEHSLKGRIRRLEYVVSLLQYFFLSLFIQWAWSDDDLYTLSFDSVWYWLFFLMLWWFTIAQTAKRCHDIGKSGWWQLIPFFNIYLLFADGNKGANEYGPNPKGE